jgi:acyl carrier protein
MSEPLLWLVSYFEQQGNLNGRSIDELLDENYVTLELLDSLGIVQLLVGIEEEFGVWLDPAEMQDPRFCSIGGLADLVEESRARDEK